jgi:hypothetical protein
VKRLNEIDSLPEGDKHCILYALDNLLASAKKRAANK